MKPGFTYIVMLLDRSGSMMNLRNDTIGGFNAFVAEQKKAAGKAVLTLAQFDNEFQIDYEARDIQSVPNLTPETFIPRGGTALRDAFARLMTSTGAKLSAMKEEDRPENVVFVVITDGAENASKEVSPAVLKEMIETQTKTYNWKFLFLGANMDAALVGGTMGVSGLSYKPTGGGILRSMDAASSYVGNTRSGNVIAANAILGSRDVEDEGVLNASEIFKKSLNKKKVN